MIQSKEKEEAAKMREKVALENTERKATESLPKKAKTGGLYQQMSKREGRIMWIGQFVYQGQKFRTNPCLTKTEAKEELQKLRFEIRQQLRVRLKERLTFTEFASEFLEDCRIKNRNYRRNVSCFGKLKPYFKERKLDEITPESINRYFNKRLQDGVKPASVNRERSFLSRMFNIAIKLGKASFNPVSRVERLKEDNRRTRIMTDEELRRLLEVCDGDSQLSTLKPFILVGRLTGMRRGELLNLKKADVDFNRGRLGVITITKSKSGAPKIVFLSELLSLYLRQRGLESSREYMLQFDRSGDTPSRFDKLWKKLLKTAGIKGLWFHDIRRTASTALYETTRNVYAAKDLLGHSSVDVTERYLVASEESRQEAVDALASGQKIRQILEAELISSSHLQ